MHQKLEPLGDLLKNYFNTMLWSLIIFSILQIINIMEHRITNIMLINISNVFSVAVLLWMWYILYEFKIMSWKEYVEIRKPINRELKRSDLSDDKILSKEIP